MSALLAKLRKNRTQWIILAILALLLWMALRGMDPKDWAITLLRGLSVGAVTFLVASGFSLIFGLLDVLNLAHGTLFMLGAYIGWTIYVRPDTFIDLLTPIALLAAGFTLIAVFQGMVMRLRLSRALTRLWPWFVMLLGVIFLVYTLQRYPVTKWDLNQYQNSPVTNAFLADKGQFTLPAPKQFSGISPVADLGGILLGSLLITLGLAGFASWRSPAAFLEADFQPARRLPRSTWLIFLGLLVVGIGAYLFNDPLTLALSHLNTSWMFLVALLVATLAGIVMGALMESTLIRPLYSRPIYQLMLTLGLSAVGIEVVRAIWGRPEFTMPKPALFDGTGKGCPANNLADYFAHKCSTILLLGGRVRTYNEIFIPLVGLVVLIGVWILLQRTRMGMIIRAGVQDREMVEALGINVRRVFTLVFALGVGLAALGGVLAGPSMGLSSVMGDNLLLNALIALAIGGLTSYPGAAAGSVLVGLMQQFIIKYGQIGIHIPFLAAPLKPTPPLVPASTVLLMVIVLLIMPQGLFGRKE
jgi:branched-chain amino acid transport system permease protein